MLTTFLDLLTTGSAIGLVSSIAALGIVVLPWTASESDNASDALDAVVRLPVDALRLAPEPTPAPAIARAAVVAR